MSAVATGRFATASTPDDQPDANRATTPNPNADQLPNPATDLGGPRRSLVSWSERIYYDKSYKKLAYARHYLVTRTDELVTYVSYAFLTTKKDPDAKDFTRISDLLAVQLRKNAKVFA